MALNFPSSPTDGQVYDQWIWSDDKGAWQAKPLDSAKTVTADVAPANPDDGDQWFNTVDGTLYIYVVDIDGGQWVESQAPITANGYYSPNYLINGGFDIWQRGTSSGWVNGYNSADRWYLSANASTTWARDSVVVAGGCQYSIKATVGASSASPTLYQAIETSNSIPMAGKTVTLSAYLATSTASTVTMNIGFSTSVDNALVGSWTSLTARNFSVTSSMSRYSGTFDIPANAKSLRIIITSNLPANATMNVTGVQLEEGTVATTFRRNANSIQGELAACQRYYFRINAEGNAGFFGDGLTFSSSAGYVNIRMPVTMRTAPSALDFSGSFVINNGAAQYAIGSFIMPSNITNSNTASLGFAATSAPGTPFSGRVLAQATTNFIGFSAEL